MKPAICALLAFAVVFGASLFVVGTLDLMSLEPVERFGIAFFSIFSAGFTYIHKELFP